MSLREDQAPAGTVTDGPRSSATADVAPPTPPETPLLDRVAARCAAVADSSRFQLAILAVIVVNAVVIGVETYPGAVEAAGDTLDTLNRLFLGIFVVELAIRLAAYGRHPWRFFTRSWNIFDFAIVAAVFLPGIGANVAALRILRVLRVVRLVEVIGDLRVIVKGLARSLAPLLGVASLVVLLTYIYAIVGNALFGEQLPDQWGTVGTAMMSCFQVLTLDNWDDLFFPAQDVSWLAVPFFLSFILLATFVVMNVVIAVVVNSVEEARRADLEDNAERIAAEVAEHAPEMAGRILALRTALDELEAQLEREATQAPPDSRHQNPPMELR